MIEQKDLSASKAAISMIVASRAGSRAGDTSNAPLMAQANGSFSQTLSQFAQSSSAMLSESFAAPDKPPVRNSSNKSHHNETKDAGIKQPSIRQNTPQAAVNGKSDAAVVPEVQAGSPPKQKVPPKENEAQEVAKTQGKEQVDASSAANGAASESEETETEQAVQDDPREKLSTETMPGDGLVSESETEVVLGLALSGPLQGGETSMSESDSDILSDDVAQTEEAIPLETLLAAEANGSNGEIAEEVQGDVNGEIDGESGYLSRRENAGLEKIGSYQARAQGASAEGEDSKLRALAESNMRQGADGNNTEGDRAAQEGAAREGGLRGREQLLAQTLTPAAATEGKNNDAKSITQSVAMATAKLSTQPGAGSAAAEANRVVTRLNTPFGQSAWSEMMQGRVNWMVQSQIKMATVYIDPPELGPVHITIHQNGDQTQINFQVQNQSVRESLEQNAHRLRESLNEQGFAQVDVNVRGGDQERADAQSDRASSGTGSGVDHDAEIHSDGEEVVTQTPLSENSGLVNTYA